MPVDENEFEEIKEILLTVARLQEGTSVRLDRIASSQELYESRMVVSQAENDRRFTEIDRRFAQLGERMDQFVAEGERDRQQAAIDRAQVRSLVEALSQRFSSNGHG